MQLYLPYLVSLITMFAGLGIWRYQLIAARRYEVIESALIAADDAVEALTQIREAENDMEWHVDWVPGSVPTASWMSTSQRIQQYESTYQDLRASTRLVTLHCGESFGREFSALLYVYERVINAHAALLFPGYAQRLDPTVSYAEGSVEWAGLVRSAGKSDSVAREIAEIKTRISARGKKYMRPSFQNYFLPLRESHDK